MISSILTTGVPGTQLPSTTTSTSTGSATTAGSTSATNPALLSQNFNTFLTLLTTQLKNQDPLSPLDTNQFTQQLVSFSEVEQQINTNTNLQSLISLQQTSQAVAALPLVGSTIQYSSSTGALTKGQASFSYSLPSAATVATLNIVNSAGQTVLTGATDPTAGTHTFNWNGAMSNGNTAPDGIYTLAVSAAGANGQAITPTITSSGTVTGVSIQNNAATFSVEGIPVPMSELVSVQPASASN